MTVSRHPPAAYDLRCSACSRAYDAARPQSFCSDCNRPLIARFHLTAILGEQIRERLGGERRGVWRYREVLPVADEAHIATLGEGGLPLLYAPRLATRLGLDSLWIKDESQNPTGSFKARGMSVAISKARELGIRRFCVPSAGNAAGAAAAYGALAGCAVRVYMPEDSGDAFFAECRAYGAEVYAVEGTIADCGKRMREACAGADWFDLSTLKEPFRLEGKKTMGYELWEDFGSDSELPDAIIYPTGGGTGLIGMWKAFEEMEQLGWIGPKRPRMISVQAEGCAPIVHAFESGAKTATPVPNPKTAALGLRVPGAFADTMILRAIRDSRGLAMSVTEEEWAEGSSWLAADVGLFASPEGGAAVAALRKAVARGQVAANDRVVVFNTGSGYKYPPATWPRPLGGSS